MYCEREYHGPIREPPTDFTSQLTGSRILDPWAPISVTLMNFSDMGLARIIKHIRSNTSRPSWPGK